MTDLYDTMSALYDVDILLWSECQADLLRRLAAGPGDGGPVIDWANVIGTIESLGRTRLRDVETCLTGALLLTLQIEAWPLSGQVPRWRSEAQGLRADAASRIAPSMRQRIDMARIWRRAIRALPTFIDHRPPGPVPETCPLSLDALLSKA
jgi:hypothetical protein